MSVILLLSKAAGVFSIFKMLLNGAKIIRFLKAMAPIAKELVEHKRLPACGESKAFLTGLGELLESGVIDLPGVDEAAIAKALKEIESEIECKAA